MEIDRRLFTIRQTNPEENSIQCKDKDTYNNMKEILKKNEIKYFTYTPKNEKPKSYVMKGLSGELTEAEVKKALTDMEIPNLDIIKVARIDKTKGEDGGISHRVGQCVYLVQINQTSDHRDLININELINQKIRWEHFKNPKVFQCRKCQRLDHASSGCKLGYRCVKCTENHEPGKCNTKELKDFSCVNCENKGHPASYRGCPFIKFAQKQIDKQKETKKKKIISQLEELQEHNPNNRSMIKQSRLNKSHSKQINEMMNFNFNMEEKLDNLLTNKFNGMKDQLVEAVTGQFSALNEKVDKNTNKIEKLYKHLGLKCE